MTAYALRHTDGAGTTHLWTCAPESAHWVARWHASDSGRPTEVLRDDGGGWRPVAVWTPGGDFPAPAERSYPDGGCLWDDEALGRPACSPNGWDDGHGEVHDDDCGCPDCDPPNNLEENPWRYRPVIDYVVL